MTSVPPATVLLMAIAASMLLVVSPTVGAAVITPSPEELAIPLCSQTQLVRVGTLLAKNEQKKACETTLNVKEMLRVQAADVQKLCDTPSCVASFKELFSTLPNCRYQDWRIKYNFKRLLQHCGVDPYRLVSQENDQEAVAISKTETTASANVIMSNETVTPRAPSTVAPKGDDDCEDA